jgi:hypothetical protein
MAGTIAEEKAKKAEQAPEERQRAETLIPITIVPRKPIEATQARELHAYLGRVHTEINSLITYSQSLDIPATRRTAQDIIAEGDRVALTLDRSKLSGVPILGVRYGDEIELIKNDVLESKKAAKEGRLAEALEHLNRAKARMAGIGELIDVQIDLLMGGTPSNLRINGMAPHESMDAILDSAEGAFRDVGTKHEKRGRHIWKKLKLYGKNSDTYNMDSEQVRAERDNLVGSAISRGKQSYKRLDYSAEDDAADARAEAGFEANLERIKSQIGTHNTRVLSSWMQELAARAREEGDEQAKKRFESLHDEVDGLLKRLKKGDEVSQDAIQNAMARYMLLTGRSVPPTEEQRSEELSAAATELRGSAKDPKENTPEWFGAQALSAINEGRLDIAGLAVAMGLLQKTAKSKNRGKDYLPSYIKITGVIADREQPSQGMMSQYYLELNAAAASAQADNIARDYSKKGPLEARKRIIASAEEVKRRLADGDIEGAKRLLVMTSAYIDNLETHRWKNWTGSKKVEKAIDAELSGKDSSQAFREGAAEYQFTSMTKQYRTAFKSWGNNIRTQRDAAQETADRVDELAAQGKMREAEALLAKLIMYTDCVEKLAIRRNGAVTALAGFSGEGMEKALRAYNSGKAQAEGMDSLFISGYALNQKNAVELEAGRLERMAERRPIGKEKAAEAIALARKRAEGGDLEGAFILLRFVSQYYGAEAPGKPEGWRYRIATNAGKGYEEARGMMLDAITMEMLADNAGAHRKAAQTFESATVRLAESEALRAGYNDLSRWYKGEASLRVEIAPGKTGEIPKGKTQIGVSAEGANVYMDLSAIRAYEKQNPDDPILKGGIALDVLLARCEGAARSGDMRRYRLASGAFADRFELVKRRAQRKQAIGDVRAQLASMDGFLASLPAYEASPMDPMYNSSMSRFTDAYAKGDTQAMRALIRPFLTENASLIAEMGDKAPAGFASANAAYQSSADKESSDKVLLAIFVKAVQMNRQMNLAAGVAMSPRRAALEQRRSALIARLNAMEKGTEELVGPQVVRGEAAKPSVLDDYSKLMLDLGSERRIAIGQSLVAQELKFTDMYLESVRRSRGDPGKEAAVLLVSSKKSLEESRAALMRGDFKGAEAAYKRAIGQRTEAMATYSAEKMFTANEATVTFNFRPAMARSGYNMLLIEQKLRRELQGSADMRISAFHDIVFGNETGDPKEHGKRMEAKLRGATLVESSIFTIPSNDLAQFFTNFRDGQSQVRSLVLAGRLDLAEKALESMQKIAADNAFYVTVGLTVIGIASAFIPVVGPYISGTIFIGMAVDRIAEEYRVYGKATPESWAMLGLTVATLGFAGAAGALKAMSTTAVLAGNVARASNLLSASRVLVGTNIAVGLSFGGYMGVNAYSMFNQASLAESQGNMELARRLRREAWFTTGMAIFPLAHMGGSLAWRGLGATPKVRTGVQMEAALDTIAPAESKAPVAIKVTETPELASMKELKTREGMFGKVREYLALDPAARAAFMERLPVAARDIVVSLAENPHIRQAIEMKVPDATRAGDFAARALDSGIRQLPTDLPPGGGPRGPGGLKPETATATNRFTNALGLADFLGNLGIPDISTAQARTARAASKAVMKGLKSGSPNERNAAGVVDGLLKDADLMADIANSRRGNPMSPESLAKLNRAQRQLGDLLPVEAERAAVTQYLQATGTGDASPMMIQPEGAAKPTGPMMMSGVPRIRASAGGGEGPGVPTPGMAEPASGGTGGPGAPAGGGRSGGPRGPRGTGPEEVPVPKEETPAPREEAKPSDGKAELRARLEELRANKPKMPEKADLERRPGEGRTPLVGKAARRARAQLKEYEAAVKDWESKIKVVEEELKLPAPEQRRALGESVRMTLDMAGRDPAEMKIKYPNADENFIQTATARTIEMMKSLYSRARARGTPPEERLACESALRRMFSYENVKQVLESAGVADPRAREIYNFATLKVREGARGGSGTPEALMRHGMRSGPTEAEILTTSDALLKGRMKAVEDAHSGLAEAQKKIPKAEEAAREAQAGYDAVKDKGGAAAGKAEKRLQAANKRLAELNAEAKKHRDLISANPLERPLKAIEDTMGKRFSPTEAEGLIKSAMDRGIIPRSAALDVYEGAHVRATGDLGAIRLENPVTETMRNALVRDMNGKPLDASLLDALRQPEVADAVGRKYGVDAKRAFNEAVKADSVDAAISAMGDATKIGDKPVRLGELSADLRTLVDRARAMASDNFFTMERFKEAADAEYNRLNQATEDTLLARETGREMVKGRASRSWGAVKNQFRTPGTLTRKALGIERLSTGRRIWRAGAEMGSGAEFPTRMRGGYKIATALLWQAALIGAASYGVYRWRSGGEISNSDMAYIQLVTGIRPKVEPKDAAWANSSKGKEFLSAFYNAFPADFPRGDMIALDGLFTERDKAVAASDNAKVTEIDDKISEILKRTLGRRSVVTDPSKIGEILKDGRQFTEKLGDINDLLRERRKAETENDTETINKKNAKLDELLKQFGIDHTKIDGYLVANNKTSLSVSDIPGLMTDTWKKNGYVMEYREAMAEKFLTNAMGDGQYRNSQMVRDLSNNPEIFLALWKAWYSGNIPGAYLSQAMTTVFQPNNLADINEKIKAGKRVDDTLKKQLTDAGQYIEITGDVVNAQGQTVKGAGGINPASFLGALEYRMVMEPAESAYYRNAMSAILKKYSGDPDAMAALNALIPLAISFNPQTGRIASGEAIYGDPMALADLVAANKTKTPDEILELARAAGFVGPASFGDIDPALRRHGKDDHPEKLIAFSRRMSDKTSGIAPWVEKNRNEIEGNGNLSSILGDLMEQCDPAKNRSAPMTPAEVYRLEPAKGQGQKETERGFVMLRLDYYKPKGWYKGLTQAEKAQKEAEDIQKAAKKGGKGEGQAAPGSVMRTVPSRLPTAPTWDRQGSDSSMKPTGPGSSGIQLVLTPDMKTFYAAKENAAYRDLAERIVAIFGDKTTEEGKSWAKLYPSGVPDNVKDMVRARVYNLLTNTDKNGILKKSGSIPTTADGAIDSDKALRKTFDESGAAVVTLSPPSLTIRLTEVIKGDVNNYVRSRLNK